MALQVQGPFLFFLLALACLSACTECAKLSHYSMPFNRSSFPSDFIFGAGSAAYQSEGAAHTDRRGPSTWDIFTKKHPEKIADGSNGDVADDFYHRYKEDIKLMKKIGLDSFRFSISWSRILPSKITQLESIFTICTQFAHPITYGDYPQSMKSLVGNRLPKFTEAESKLLKGSLDFLGLNYYTTNYAESAASNSVNISYVTDRCLTLTTVKNGTPIGTPTALDWLYVYPKGIRELVLYIKKNYNNPMIYITENGVADENNSSLPIKDVLKDSLRIRYHYAHLSYLSKAIKEGVNVRGYYAWSFFDDFEWDVGYSVRFGLTFVDFKNNLKRHLKYSAYWFKMFLLK
ncbi:vicianin hydrolase-like [Quercus suber]|uniref:vicianin hydrolase-like n=1 Tax=Quercus suber TaxID=58331 RepID=UPI0032DFE20A